MSHQVGGAEADYDDGMAQRYDEVTRCTQHKHILAVTLKKLVGDVNGKACLDAACGNGVYMHHLHQQGAAFVAGVDLSQKNLEIARAQHALEKVPEASMGYVQADLSEPQLFAGHPFDLVIMSCVVCYSSSQEQLGGFFKTAFMNLKPGGRLVLVNTRASLPTAERDELTELTGIKYDVEPASPYAPVNFAWPNGWAGTTNFVPASEINTVLSKAGFQVKPESLCIDTEYKGEINLERLAQLVPYDAFVATRPDTADQEQELWNKEYGDLAKNAEINGLDPVCYAMNVQLGYTEDMLKKAPVDCQMGIGCGCPPKHLQLQPGMQCLDIGSGAGLDAILCAKEVQGNGGKAIGLDILPEMIERASGNAAKAEGLDAGVTEFKLGNVNAGELPNMFKNETFDAVTSNCCVCLFNQDTVIPHIFNVLKSGGTFCFAESMRKAPFGEDSPIYNLFREAYQKVIYPVGRDASCKGFRASIACTHENPMTPEQIQEVLKKNGFINVTVCCALPNPTGTSQKPLACPTLGSTSLSADELADFQTRFGKAWADYDIDSHVTYVCIKATKP